MTDQAAWHEANDAFLSAAVRWLRLRLEQLAEAHLPPSEPPAAPPPAERRGFWSRLKEDLPALPLLPARAASATDPVDEAAASMAKAAEGEPPPALKILSRRLGLGPFEEQVLLLCAGMELDTRIGALCAQAQGDGSRPYPTFALALALFDNPVWEALAPERPLRHWRLIEINQPGAQPLTASALRADERVVSYLKGLNYLDDRLTPLLAPIVGVSETLPASHRQLVDQIIRQLHATAAVPVVNLLGADGASKHAVAAHAATGLELVVYRLSADMLPAGWGELETLARLWQRESYLSPVALYLDAQDLEKDLPAVSRILTRISGLAFLATRDAWPQPSRDVLTIEVEKPTPDEQRELWTGLLGGEAGELPYRLSGQFSLSQLEIHRIAALASAKGESSEERTWHACLVASRPRLDTLAQRLEVKEQSWDDLILPAQEKALLRQVMDQVGQRHRVYEAWGFGRRLTRGLGISALFAGESGTGKTLAAEVIARELQLNLYRIDLSQVVSKYIGETEKNLRKLFDAAEDGGTILFFDEADALFGKRSEVKDSHDRYANIEINYLLQRMDAYRGLAILATNMKSALDQAFMRRLRFVVTFPFPGVSERQHIWARVFPEQAETEGLDYGRLARLNLTGGSIQNIAINAAFLAASAGRPITMDLIAEAARGEFRKLDKPVNESDFRVLRPVEATA
jgi:hypothetical protein